MPSKLDGTRENLFRILVTIDGKGYGEWDSWAGGDPTLANVKYRSGGEVFEENLGGPGSYSDLTIGRNYRLSRDHAIIGPLLNALRIAAGAVVTKTPLKRDYTVFGTPIVATGILIGVVDPKVDSNANNPAMITFTLAVTSLTPGK